MVVLSLLGWWFPCWYCFLVDCLVFWAFIGGFWSLAVVFVGFPCGSTLLWSFLVFESLVVLFGLVVPFGILFWSFVWFLLGFGQWFQSLIVRGNTGQFTTCWI
jgi:hypothetical protein